MLRFLFHPPTMVKEIGKAHWARPEIALEDNLKCLSFMGYDVEPDADYLSSRKVFLMNDDMQIGMACPSKSMNDYFFKNSDADEMLFIHKGSGRCKTMYGTVDFDK